VIKDISYSKMAAFNTPQGDYELYETRKEYEQDCYESYDGDSTDLVWTLNFIIFC